MKLASRVAGVLLGLSVGCGSSAVTPDAGGSSDAYVAPDTGAVTDGGAPIDTGAAVDVGPSTTYPAPHPAPPRVVDLGGPVLVSPVLHAVTFGGDDPTVVAQLTDFVAQLGATAYWHATTSEYGVGAATAGPAIALTETPTGTLDDVAIQSWLAGKLNADDPAFPAADENTLFVLFYPAGVTVTSGSATGCSDFGSYHSNLTLDAAHGNRDVAYVVTPRCTTFGGVTGIGAMTAPTSGVLVSAATDPHPLTTPAYGGVDETHTIWLYALGGGEVGSLCAQESEAFTTFAELPYAVQRSWSNAAAMAGHDPCVPAPSTPYFAAAPVLPDTSMVAGAMIESVHIAVGATRTVEVDLFSDAATSGPISVTALDLAALSGGTPHLSLAIDPASGLNGQHLVLSITVLSAGTGGSEPFVLSASVGGASHLWVGAVTR